MDESIGIIGGIFYLAVIILMVVSLWKIFEKAGKPGWSAIVPIYNTIIILEIVGKPVWWIVLLLIPFVNALVGLYLIVLLAQSFNKSTGFAIGMILLPFVFYPMLAFGDATYHGPAGLQKSDF
jgi:hypothetical protein